MLFSNPNSLNVDRRPSAPKVGPREDKGDEDEEDDVVDDPFTQVKIRPPIIFRF